MEQTQTNGIPGADQVSVDAATPKKITEKPKKKRKWPKRLAIAALVIAAGFFVFVRPRIISAKESLSALYRTDVAGFQDVTVAVSGTGTVEPIDAYRVTALVRGEILEAPFEEGEMIEEDDLLFRIDAKDVENSIARAELAVEQARLGYNNLLTNEKNTRVTSEADGTVQTLYVDEGDTVAAGTAVAQILDRETMTLKLPFHAHDAAGFYPGQGADVTVDGTLETLSGTVKEVSAVEEVGAGGTLVRQVTIQVKNPGALAEGMTGAARVGEAGCAASGNFTYAENKTVYAKTSGEIARLAVKEGDRVTDGQVIATFDDDSISTQIENARLSLRNAELGLQSARDQLENYTITSPISGTVIEKNFKAGDNLDATTADYLAVVYDMSALTFEMMIDELDIGKIKVGQSVEITADAIEGRVFSGFVDKININGLTSGGVTAYPVTVRIEDTQELLPGMNVSADMIVERVNHVLCIPVDAVERGNKVLVSAPGAVDENGKVTDPAKLETRTVTLGRSDADYIEVLDGLEEGDVVAIRNQGTSILDMMGMGN